MIPKKLTPKRRAFIRREEALRRKYCVYCRVPLHHPGAEITLDHRNPRSRGGRDSRRNLVPVCRKCNQEKANKTHEEYLLYLRRKPGSRIIENKVYAPKRYPFCPPSVIAKRRLQAKALDEKPAIKPIQNPILTGDNKK